MSKIKLFSTMKNDCYIQDIKYYMGGLNDSMLDSEDLVLCYSHETLILNFDMNYVKRQFAFRNKEDCILFKIKYGL